MKTWITLACISLLLLGFYLDAQTNLSEMQLRLSFYLAGFIGMNIILWQVFKKLASLPLKIFMLVLAWIAWRISYFPIMVLAGYIAGFWEEIHLAMMGYSSIYPAFLVVMALMNALAIALANYSLLAILQLVPIPKRGLLPITFLLGGLASTLSFMHPNDWTFSPETTQLDNKALPLATWPQSNPYALALNQTDTNWRQRTLFVAASLTYQLIPQHTRWSQWVKGTLEQEFQGNADLSSHLCTKVHYRAFQTAQSFLHSNVPLANAE